MFENDKCLIGKHLIYFAIGYNANPIAKDHSYLSEQFFFHIAFTFAKFQIDAIMRQ